MRTEYLEYLVEVSKTKSMSLASKNMYISHQGIVCAINKLESELGVSLLIRNKNGVRLTQVGEKLVDWAKDFLDELNVIKTEIVIGEDSLANKITICADPFYCSVILPTTVLSFKKKFPNIKINIIEMDTLDVLDMVATGKADIGLIMIIKDYLKKLLPDFQDSLLIEELYHDYLYLRVGKSSQLASRESISLKEILQYPIALYTTRNIIEYLELYSYLYGKPQVTMVSNNRNVNLLAISEGQAVGFSTNYSKNFDVSSESTLAIPISDKIKLFFGCVKTKNIVESKCSEEFISIIKRKF